MILLKLPSKRIESLVPWYEKAADGNLGSVGNWS